MHQVQHFRDIILKSNFHEFRLNPNRQIHHYVLDITQSTPELVIEAYQKYRQTISQLLGQYISINQNIYSPKQVEDTILGSLDSNMEIPPLVSLRYQHTVTAAVDIQLILARLFKQVMRSQYQMVSTGYRGERLFWPNRKIDLQELAIWPGVEVILKMKFVVVDSAFKILRMITVLDELRKHDNLDNLVGLTVMTKYNNRFYRIDGIDINQNPQSKFIDQQSQSISYAEYYQTKYNIILEKNQPLIRTIIKKRREQLEHVVYLIPQLCQMTGLTDKIRSNYHEMQRIAETTQPNAQQRKDQGAAFTQQLAGTTIKQQNSTLFKQWGVEINNNQKEIKGRQIHPGNLLMGQDKEVDPFSNLDHTTQGAMYKNPNKGVVCSIVYNSRTGQESVNTLERGLKAGMIEMQFQVFNSPILKTLDQDSDQNLVNVLKELVDKQIGFIIFLLPGRKKDAKLYRTAKLLTMQMIGCPSQVVLEGTLMKNTRSIINKLIVQICAKLGGTPWGIKHVPKVFQDTPTMICGVDCFEKYKKPTQLAFCSTNDRWLSRYHSQVITGGNYAESLSIALKGAINAFKSANNIMPDKIVIYRDGISDGQSVGVLAIELPQYQQAITELGIQAKLILIICNKRVTGKFYTSGQRVDNPPTGTLIDSLEVCDVKQPNFYLISQTTKQGTVSPTFYRVLHSDIPNINDDIKVLTYKLCWLYYNSAGPIKVPAPLRYAHCLSNFIGTNYRENEKTPFIPILTLVQQNVLYYI